MNGEEMCCYQQTLTATEVNASCMQADVLLAEWVIGLEEKGGVVVSCESLTKNISIC